MTAQTDPDSEQADLPRRVRLVGAGLLAAGTAALVVALVLPTEPARFGLPTWIWTATVGLLVASLGVAVSLWWRWTEPVRWRFGLGVGAAVVGAWAVPACVADIRGGMPGSALPWLAVGCVALLVAAVLGVSAPVRRGSVVRQALPAVLAVVAVVAAAVAVDVVGWRIPVDATIAEPVDGVGVPGLPARVRWTSTWPTARLADGRSDPTVVSAGAGVVVASRDRVVALDGSNGAERWHYRRAGARIHGLTASPDDATVVAEIAAGGEEPAPAELFVFDAYTGELLWTRPSTGYVGVTDVALVERLPDESGLVGVRIRDVEEVWTWTPAVDCELHGTVRPSVFAMLVPVLCRDPEGHRFHAVIGVDVAHGTEMWRYDGPPVTVPDPSEPELIVRPDGTLAWYRPREEGTNPVLLYTTLGEAAYQAPDDTELVGLSDVHLVLRRGTGQLLVRTFRTPGPETERPLASECPVPGSPLVLPGSVKIGTILVPCFVGPRADIEVHSTEGFLITTINVRAKGAVPSGLLAADGAVVLVVRHPTSGSVVLVGLG